MTRIILIGTGRDFPSAVSRFGILSGARVSGIQPESVAARTAKSLSKDRNHQNTHTRLSIPTGGAASSAISPAADLGSV
jgi:hypothetical protein